MREIQLTQGKVAVVDIYDFYFLSLWKWHAAKMKSGIFYAKRSEWNPKTQQNETIFMHQVLAKAPEGLEVDHINGNGLDNRRTNLRVCTHAVNMANRHPKIA